MNKLIAAILLCFSFSLVAQQRNVEKALSYIQEREGRSNFSPTDFEGAVITDQYTSGGITHVYFQQTYEGIGIQHARAAAHWNEHETLYTTNQFLPELKKRTIQRVRSLSAADAVASIAQEKNYPLNRSSLKSLSVNTKDKQQKTMLSAAGVSNSNIPAHLVYVVNEEGNLRLAWDIGIEPTDGSSTMHYRVDAQNGDILNQASWRYNCYGGSLNKSHSPKCTHHVHAAPQEKASTANNCYNVLALPHQSPNYDGVPGVGRSIEIAPWLANPEASPNGWHNDGTTEYTDTRGNNIDAYSVQGGTATYRPDGGSNRNFDFPHTLDTIPYNFSDAIVTQVFYWGNLMHDVWYNYGFDEVSGNFQENNFGKGGIEGDPVEIVAQIREGGIGPFFEFAAEGTRGKINLFALPGALFGGTEPKDIEFDNALTAHEYGHGITSRLVGGPSVLALDIGGGTNNEPTALSEGWSNYFGLVMNIKPTDQGEDRRRFAFWFSGLDIVTETSTDAGFSTDPTLDPSNFGTINNPPGFSFLLQNRVAGFAWTSMLWEMTWALIDEYGFDEDVYSGTGGNNIAMKLVIEGLKQTPTLPGFVDARDAILAADMMLYDGKNQCLLWEAFAKRGLGFGAKQGSRNGYGDETVAYDLPNSCYLDFEKTASTNSVAPGQQITYTLSAINNSSRDLTNVIISDEVPEYTTYLSGGNLNGNMVNFPAFFLPKGESRTQTFTVQVDPIIESNLFYDDAESGSSLGKWSTSNDNWDIVAGVLDNDSQAWFASVDTTIAKKELILTNRITIPSIPSNVIITLSFTHQYDLVSSEQGASLFFSIDNGSIWYDFDYYFTQNGYNDELSSLDPIFSPVTQTQIAQIPAFSGNSGGPIESILDLSSLAGRNILIKFVLYVHSGEVKDGWWIDDIKINRVLSTIPNTAQVTDGIQTVTATLDPPTAVTNAPLEVEVITKDIRCHGEENGEANVIVNGGTGNYTYAWSTGATTPNISELPAGVYSIEVSDAINTINRSIEILEPSAFVMFTSTEPASDANTADGSLQIISLGGSGTHQYQWVRLGEVYFFGQGAINDNLPHGVYSCQVTDSVGCQNYSFAIIENASGSSYCPSFGYKQTHEYIQSISLASLQNESGNDNGYRDFTGLPETLPDNLYTELSQGTAYSIFLEPAYVEETVDENWRIWVDFNQDNDFDDPGEEVLALTTVSGSVSGSFNIPPDAMLGPTRMRIGMKFYSPPEVCGFFTYGEVEDYTVVIVQ